MQESYHIERTCLKCGNKNQISVSKKEAAFELVDVDKILGQECKKCSGELFSTSYEKPNLDLELCKEWSSDLELHLMPQDEELLLADEKYLELILEVLDTVQMPNQKQNTLIEALCVIVYDNSADDNPKKDSLLKNRVIGELNKRPEKLKLADGWIMDYIKEVVFEQLEIIKNK